MTREDSAEEEYVHGNESVLVMDDDKAVQAVYRESLNHLGYDIEIVDHGEAAVRRYAEKMAAGRRFDLGCIAGCSCS